MDTLNIALATLIQSFYVGGIQKFSEDGGNVAIIVNDPIDLLVYHPNIPINFKNVFVQFAERTQINVRFLTTLNFEGHTPEEIQGLFENNFDTIVGSLGLHNVMVKSNPLFCAVMILDKADRAVAEKVVSRLREIVPGLIRIYVYYPGGVYHTEFRTDEEPVRKTLITGVHPDRTAVIGEDDLTNLKIALGNAQSVDDFINSI
jgi:hypothetical protein